MATNLTKQDYKVTQQMRAERAQHQSMVIWFVGLSGSGKSTVSDALESFLFSKGMNTYTLDGDNIRMGINKDLGFTSEARSENLRRIAEVGKLFTDAGVITLTAFITPLEEDRKRAKQILGDKYFGSKIFLWFPTFQIDRFVLIALVGLYVNFKKGLLQPLRDLLPQFRLFMYQLTI